ncbi:MAG: hypothetical protein F6K36_07270 [Symploca sp. SIO3C6]|uniref:Uncharacterized protein n=1 Tax=Symploca sp. SIO1C4 TaxID=2607765 RepID=A0A6B3NEQ9_9CYAN|nr:hypothetical protein [Symploca sp. SIO3C6]NER30103.1 hypothetical protein [Symploca sp. SIO1C4]
MLNLINIPENCLNLLQIDMQKSKLVETPSILLWTPSIDTLDIDKRHFW